MGDPQTVHDWLAYIAALNVGGISREEVELRLAVLSRALAEEFPTEVFTPETARTIARRTKYLPTFGEICEVLQPFAQAARESRRIMVEYSGLPPLESREPYQLPPPPDWCFDREPRNMGRAEPGERNIRDPIRTPAEQYAEIMGCPLADAEARLGATANA